MLAAVPLAATAATASTPGILTALLILPLVGAFLIARFRKEQEKQIKATAVFFAVIVFVASLYLPFAPSVRMGDVAQPAADGTPVKVFNDLSPDRAALEFAGFEHVTLLGTPNITWCVGVDGISLWLVLLTAFLTPLVMLGSYDHIKEHVKEYFVCFLVLEAGMIGALIALDLVVFYAFFELMLIPMYLIIGIWGHDRRIFAAVKFFIYTMVGSLLMFVAVIACYWSMPEGHQSFNLIRMYEHLNLGPGPQFWVFLAFALSFGIKVPIFPFHTWLPDAHVEAPTGGSVILAGVLLKMGTYGFIRFALPLFPYASWYCAPLLLTLGVIGVIFAAWMAWVQDDLKKLVAYSSVSHLGFAMLGIFAVVSLSPSPHKIIGLEGATFIGISHGLTAAALFMLVGVIYNRRHTRQIDEFGGLAKVMPWYAACFMIATLGSVGLSGTSGFVGEFSALLGVFNMQGTFTFLFFTIDYWWFVVFGGLGVIF
ncbi:MAG: NuoM family protein, partial [Planctomycetota bacterium]